MIKLENIYKAYSKKFVLKNVNLEVHDQEFICLVGESGSGKSTLLRIIAGLTDQTHGKVFINDKELAGTNMDVSMVFQSAALLPWLTLEDNILFPFKVQHVQPDLGQIHNLIASMELSGLERSYPRNLSGGQRQRVGLARALAMERPILLLDEPFSALDIKTAEDLRKDLLRVYEERKLTVVMVSHLIEEAVQLADRVLVLKDGAISAHFKIDLEYPRKLESKEFLVECDKIREVLEKE